MSTLDLQIDRLRMDVANAAGQEHRIGAIATRAAEIFATRLDAGFTPESRTEGTPPAKVNLQVMGDEEAASTIAEGWLRAVALKLV